MHTSKITDLYILLCSPCKFKLSSGLLFHDVNWHQVISWNRSQSERHGLYTRYFEIFCKLTAIRCVQTGRHPGAEHLSSTHVAPREIRLAPFAPRWRRAERLLDVPTCCNKSAWTIFALKIEMNWWKCTLAINIRRYWENPSTCRIDRCAARTHQIRAWLHHTYHNVQLLSSNLDKLITQLSRQGTPHTCNWQGYTLHM